MLLEMRALVSISLVALLGTSSHEQPRSLRCLVAVPPSNAGSGRIGVFALGSEGRLAWTDGRPGQVMIKDARGRIRAVGRTGSGPGEFRNVATLGWWGDTLWAGDASVPRVQFFSDTGAFLRGITAMTRASWAPRRGGALVGFAPRRLSADLPLAAIRQRNDQRVDTIAQWPLVPAPRVMLENTGPRGNPQPFATEIVVGASPDHSRFCSARPSGDAWLVECLDDSSNQLMQRRVSLSGRELTDELFDSMLDRFSRGREPADVRRKLWRPRTLPAVNGMSVADNGDVWLQRSHPFERSGVWQRVTRSGIDQREVDIAPLSRVLLFTRDSVWGTRTDDDGLESLLRCAMQP